MPHPEHFRRTCRPDRSRALPRARVVGGRYPQLWAAAGEDDHARVLKLLLTGQRRGEIAGMTWAELVQLRLPPSLVHTRYIHDRPQPVQPDLAEPKFDYVVTPELWAREVHSGGPTTRGPAGPGSSRICPCDSPCVPDPRHRPARPAPMSQEVDHPGRMPGRVGCGACIPWRMQVDSHQSARANPYRRALLVSRIVDGGWTTACDPGCRLATQTLDSGPICDPACVRL
jgi:hypothetical protein